MKRGLAWMTAAAWTVVAIWLSWQPGTETVGLSLQIARFLLRILGFIGVHPNEGHFHMGLRLAAHIGVFFVEGIFITVALRTVTKNPCAFLIGVLSAVAVSVLIEVLKPLFPGRHFTWSETWLNVMGAICGSVIPCLSVLIRKMKQKE